jgi:hypothetical protein
MSKSINDIPATIQEFIVLVISKNDFCREKYKEGKVFLNVSVMSMFELNNQKYLNTPSLYPNQT